VRLVYSSLVISLRASFPARALACASALIACGGDKFTAGAAADAGSPVDAASVDAADEAPAAGPSYCATHAGEFDLCDDFDTNPLPLPFDGPLTFGSATIQTDQADSKSPPSSLLFGAPALAGANGSTAAATAYANLSKTGLTKGTTHIDLDLKIEELSFPDPADTQAGEAILTVAQGKLYSVVLAFRASATAPFTMSVIETLMASTPTVAVHDIPANQAPVVGAWAHLKITVKIAAQSGSYAIQIDASPTQTFPLTPPSAIGLSDRSITVGLTARGATGALKGRMDNVTYIGR
jgi:hypothetical protein